MGKWKFCRIYWQWILIEQNFLYTVVHRAFLYNPTNLKVPKKAPCWTTNYLWLEKLEWGVSDAPMLANTHKTKNGGWVGGGRVRGQRHVVLFLHFLKFLRCSSRSGFRKSYVVTIDVQQWIFTLVVGKYRPRFERTAPPYCKLDRIRINLRILLVWDEILIVTTLISYKITPWI